MRKARVFTMVAAILLVAGVVLPAQEKKSTGSKELTIEELFLRNVEFQVLREKAFSDDYEMKLTVLDDLDKMLTEGTVGNNTAQVEFVLEYLAQEGSIRTVREDRRVINNFPEVRRRAANLLGRLGGQDASKALVTVMLGDNEPMVKAEAAYGLGVIGLDNNSETIQALAYALDKEDPTRPDNNYAYAIVLAIEKIGQKTTGGIKDPSAYRALIKIAQGNYLRTVKAKAFQVLDTMKQAK